MEHSKLKLCWMHPESKSRIANHSSCCCHSTPIKQSVNLESLPDCHEGCTYYSRCKRVFEIGRFSNSCWDAPDPFLVNAVDTTSMRATQRIRTDIHNFVNNGSNLLLYSAYSGNGKTSRAISISNTYISIISQRETYNFDHVASYAYIPKIVADYEIYDKNVIYLLLAYAEANNIPVSDSLCKEVEPVI